MVRIILRMLISLRWAYFHIHPGYQKFYIDADRTEAHFFCARTNAMHPNYKLVTPPIVQAQDCGEGMKIYVLVAIHDHEGYSMIKAFSDQKAAESLCDACNLYVEEKPLSSLEMSGDQYDDFLLDLDEWEEKHPAGDSSGDSYDVREIELV